jgi:hypothetical protein
MSRRSVQAQARVRPHLIKGCLVRMVVGLLDESPVRSKFSPDFGGEQSRDYS